MADKIVAMSDAHVYLTGRHHFDDAELDLLMRYRNPLEIFADELLDRRNDLDDCIFSMDSLMSHQSDAYLSGYALADAAVASNMPPPPKLPAADKKPSIGDRIKAGKKKSDACKAKNPDVKTKKEKEIE